MLPPTLHCRAAATAAALRAAATALPPPCCRYHAVRHCSTLRCCCHLAPAMLPPTMRCHAATTTAASTLLPPRCRRHAVHRRRPSRCCHRCRAAAKLPCYKIRVLRYLHTLLTYQSHVNPLSPHCYSSQISLDISLGFPPHHVQWNMYILSGFSSMTHLRNSRISHASLFAKLILPKSLYFRISSQLF